MTDDLNPQAKEMADKSMVRNLAAQAEAIWPQEQPLFGRYGVPTEADILDAGCGTGEISVRLARMFDHARLLGVDVIPPATASGTCPCCPAVSSPVLDLGVRGNRHMSTGGALIT